MNVDFGGGNKVSDYAKMMSAYQVSKSLKMIRCLMEVGRFERAIMTADDLKCAEYDTDLFDVYDEYYIREKIDSMMVFISCEQEEIVKDMIKDIRREVLDKIFTKRLLIASRLRKNTKDVGTLDHLPDLVKFEISKYIYDYM